MVKEITRRSFVTVGKKAASGMVQEDVFYREIGRRIRQARKAAGVTQQSLAAHASLSRASITNMEQGRQKVMVHTLVQIALALRVPPAYLLPPVEERQELPLDDLLRQRTRSEQAWIGEALTSYLPERSSRDSKATPNRS